MLDLHVGIRTEDVEAFERIFGRDFEPGFVQVQVDDTEWNTWGPHKTTDTEVRDQSQDLLHVVLTTQSPMILLNYLVNRLFVFLNPLEDTDSQFHGRFIIVTDHKIWNQYYVELSYPE